MNAQPVLKADALKFIMTFRSQMSKEHLLAAMPRAIALLQSQSAVVVSYSAGAPLPPRCCVMVVP